MQAGDTTQSGGKSAAMKGAIIGGVVLGTAVAVAGYQFCQGSESNDDCGGLLGIAGGFAIGAVVGAVLGGFIGSAVGD